MRARGLDTTAATDEIAGTLSGDFTVGLRTVRVRPRPSDVLGALEPTQTRESRNTQSLSLRFRGLLTEEGDRRVQLESHYQRNEKALVLALIEMYIEGVSTRKVTEVTETLCGTSFSKSLVSQLAGHLDAELEVTEGGSGFVF